MHLTSSGGSLALRPLGYRFAVPRGDHYDDNWLTIAGRVTAPAGAWKFQEPALLTDEAERLTRWLRATAAGRTPVAVPREDAWSPSLEFLEPLVTFSVAARSPTTVTLRLTLRLEASPPWSVDEDGDPEPYDVRLELTGADLLAAADDWEHELLPFPGR